MEHISHKYPSLYMTYLFINICTYMYKMAPVVGFIVPFAYESPCTELHPRKLKFIICSTHFTPIFHDTLLSVRVEAISLPCMCAVNNLW